MKKILSFFGIILALAAPSAAFAFTSSISPNSDPVRGAFTVHLTSNNPNEFSCNDGDYLQMDVVDPAAQSSALNPAEGFQEEIQIVGGSVDHIWHFSAFTFAGADIMVNCNATPGSFWAGGSLTMISPGVNFISGFPVFGLSTGLATGAIGGATDTLADPGIVKITMVVIGLPLVFWIIIAIRDLFPGRMVGKGYDAMDRPFYVRRRGRKKYRDYLDGKI